MRHFASALAVLSAAVLLIAAAFPALAQSDAKSERASARASRAKPVEIKLGVGHGIGFLPLYLAQDLKLFDKHAKAAGVPARISIRRFYAGQQLRQALAKGEIEAGSFGLPAFLLSREGGRDLPKNLIAISGVTTLPLVLLTARSDVGSITDLKPNERIALPMLTAPQAQFLRMQTERFAPQGTWNRLRQQIVEMPHQDAIDSMSAGRGNVTAYFSSPPFTQIALKDKKFRALMSSDDIIGGKSSFLILASARETVAAQPKLAEVVSKAVDEAAALIAKDPRRAAMTYLKYEPSHTLDARSVEAILRDLKDDFGSNVHGVEAMASFMHRTGRLKNAPQSWQDVVAPALAAGSGS